MKKYLLLIGILMFIPNLVYANEDATISVKSSKNNVKVDDKITITVDISSNSNISYYEYTLDYDPNKLSLLKGSPYNVNKVNNPTKKVSKTFDFKVIAKGTSKVSIKSFSVINTSKDNLDVKIDPITISTEKSNVTLSDNNYLSSLEVEGYKISPKFDKDITSYSIELDSDLNKINIMAKAEHSKSKVTGTGNIELIPGENKLEIIVTSESGKDKVYNITVNPDSNDPIKVSINNQQYTIVKNISNLEKPKNYKTKEITIDGKKVTALYNETTNYLLVGLKDKSNNIELYIYDKTENSYTLYTELTFNNIIFIPIETDKELNDFTEDTITIEDLEINCFKLNKESDYCIIYGMNTTTGDEGWYSYNINEKTIQKYNFEIDKYYEEKIKNSEVLIYILAGTTLIFGITVITLAIKANQKKRK